MEEDDKHQKKRIYLDQKAWAEIQARYDTGESLKSIAKDYGIDLSTISKRAKRNFWKGHGELATSALAEAREKAKEEITDSYEQKIKENNERQLKELINLKALAQKAMFILNKRMDVKLAVANSHGKYEEILDKIEKGEISEKELLKSMPDVTREIYSIAALIQSLKTATMDYERVILGMEDAPAIKKETYDGLARMAQIFEESSRLHWDQVIAQGIADMREERKRERQNNENGGNIL